MTTGLCACGCGGTTWIATYTLRSKGWERGKPVRYMKGHHRRKSGSEWKSEDRGYETPCWIWQLARSSNGYGSSGHRPAHRVIFEKYRGRVEQGLQIDHLCRVKECVNPDHLEAVTPQENVRRQPNLKLSLEAAQQIREALAQGVVGRRLAEQFGVSDATISYVKSGGRWREV